MNQTEIEEIRRLYCVEEKTYKEVSEITGFCTAALTKILKGIRSQSDANKISRKKGRYKLSEEGRQVLSENGKKACARSGKCWTKPEREFKEILNSLNIGVKFPQYIEEVFSVISDNNAEINFQYPLQRYVCDFVDVARKLVYQVNGDFWHANPILYHDKELTKIQKQNIRIDSCRKKYLESLNFEVYDFWESEIYWNVELVKEKILATRKMVNPTVLHAVNTAFDSPVANSDWSEKLKSLWFKPPKNSIRLEIICKQCGKKFSVVESKKDKKLCSTECKYKNSRKANRPSPEELNKMVWERPTEQIAEELGISGNALKKWCDQYGIEKPPRGYWQKVKFGKI